MLYGRSKVDECVAFLAGGDTGFDYALPYGTLLAAMLLNAADELDSAIRDIDEWVADNSPAQDRARAEQSWLVFALSIKPCSCCSPIRRTPAHTWPSSAVKI